MKLIFQRHRKSIGRLDRAAIDDVIRSSGGAADKGLHTLSVAANKGVLWLAVAGVMAARSGTPRRAAARGLIALGAASASNGTLKAVLPFRPRPQHLPSLPFWPPEYHGSSLPSGHSASAAAFATGVALVSPALGAIVAPLAAGVAYSRVHIGAHWPSNVILGSTLGIAAAVLTRNWHPWPLNRP
ncbi:MAG: hypothetical protein NVS2B15_03360 [Pseudarthrobacter sp.]